MKNTINIGDVVVITKYDPPVIGVIKDFLNSIAPSDPAYWIKFVEDPINEWVGADFVIPIKKWNIKKETQPAIVNTLKGWVKDYIITRKHGNVKLAKELKKSIDRVIQKYGLDRNEIYFYYGDPDSRKNNQLPDNCFNFTEGGNHAR